MKKFLLAVMFLLVMQVSAFAAEKAIPVMQSTYNYMKFYVYKPKNLPKGFYVTFDGYMVYTAPGGVWKYASAETSGITKTNYVVGDVVPSALNIKPYSKNLSSVSPVLGTGRTESQPSVSAPASARTIYTPPLSSSGRVSASSLSPNASDWTQNSNFMAVGKWQKSIDRIGVLNSPMIPVAWKGDYPEVIYAWTGLQWTQILPASKYTPALGTIRRGIYDLAVSVNKLNALHWTNDDSYVLSQHASVWGYKWLGLINTGRSF